MFFSTHYTDLNSNTNINLISSYKNIRNKFILLYIKKKNINYIGKNKELYSDAIIYSIYYLYWKIYGCIYSNEIMELIYDIEFLN
jgi:hypothetical protein